ncbi:MAG: hypothetical protein E6J40_08075 [Chloroflexi bacterium]|nr:MAG: hypothetical protein E6J40_08075 [Chloroflexota bacterium]
MNPIDPSNFMPDDFARHLEQHREELRQLYGPYHHSHSRSGRLARFLQRLADRVDPTGEARLRS